MRRKLRENWKTHRGTKKTGMQVSLCESIPKGCLKLIFYFYIGCTPFEVMYGRQSNSVTNPLFCSESTLQSESDKGEEDGSITQVVFNQYNNTYLRTYTCQWQTVVNSQFSWIRKDKKLEKQNKALWPELKDLKEVIMLLHNCSHPIWTQII